MAMFDGRVAIVTGAGNGLGRTYAIGLARRGALVVVNDLGVAVDGSGPSRAAADRVVEEIIAAGGRAVASYDTVATPVGARAIVERALDSFGRLDILINNAGVLRHGPIEAQTEEDIELTMGTHLFGSLYVTQAAMPAMRQGRYGRIVMTASAAGVFGMPWLSSYGAAKSGVVGLMNVVAIEGKGDGILCNTILPCAETRFTASDAEQAPPLLRRNIDAFNAIGHGRGPEFVAPMVLYLASDRCEVTHAIFSAGGGRYAQTFIGLTEGWRGPHDAPAEPEDIARHFAQICDRSRYGVPDDGAEEMFDIARGQAG